MRSRYSAYVRGLADYLRQTWHPDTRPAELSLDEAPGQRTHWLGLTVHEHTVTGADSADVRFTARYRSGGGSAVNLTSALSVPVIAWSCTVRPSQCVRWPGASTSDSSAGRVSGCQDWRR